MTTLILSLPAILGVLLVLANLNTGGSNVGMVLAGLFVPLAAISFVWALFCYVLRTIVSICRNAGK